MKILFFLFLLFYSITSFSQNAFYFQYDVEATEEYKAAKNMENENWFKIQAISELRKFLFSNLFVEGYFKNDTLLIKPNFEELKKGIKIDEKSSRFSDKNPYGAILVEGESKLTGKYPNVNLFFDFKNKYQLIVLDDTLKKRNVKPMKQYHFIPTYEKTMINDWHCEKWLVIDSFAQDSFAHHTEVAQIWISKDIPQSIHPGLLFSELEGGLVQANCSSGHILKLRKFEQGSNFKFPLIIYTDYSLEQTKIKVSKEHGIFDWFLNYKESLDLIYEFKY